MKTAMVFYGTRASCEAAERCAEMLQQKGFAAEARGFDVYVDSTYTVQQAMQRARQSK